MDTPGIEPGTARRHSEMLSGRDNQLHHVPCGQNAARPEQPAIDFLVTWIKTITMSGSTISLKIEFGGGMELLFANKRSHDINIPAQVPIDNKTEPSPPDADTKPADITYLIHYLKDHLLKEREELFIEKGTM